MMLLALSKANNTSFNFIVLNRPGTFIIVLHILIYYLILIIDQESEVQKIQ